MDQPENDPGIAQLVAEINNRKRAKHEQIARIIFNDPYPVCATRQQFEEVKILCKSDYGRCLLLDLRIKP